MKYPIGTVCLDDCNEKAVVSSEMLNDEGKKTFHYLREPRILQ